MIKTHVCAASITISISLNNHQACGDVSHAAYMAWNESHIILIPVQANDSAYEFVGLSPQTEYNIIVVIINNDSFREFSKSAKTLVSKCTCIHVTTV